MSRNSRRFCAFAERPWRWRRLSSIPFMAEAAKELNIPHVGTLEAFERLPESQESLRPSEPDEVAYLQYTSGSTLFPRGVVITQKAVLANLNEIIIHGLKLRPGDRAFSWLPFYHDMGLVGFVLGPMVSQISVDYLKTWMFAMRPLLWLSLMTRTKATISFSPSFGYQLCVKRLRRRCRQHFRSRRVAGRRSRRRNDPVSRLGGVCRSSGAKRV